MTSVTGEFVDALGDLLTDFLGIVVDIESSASGRKGIYSVKELRVMHMVFRYWRRNECCTATQIAIETGISKTTVSRAITTLMTNGLLKERSDPEDGRRRLLLPTEQGQATVDNVNAWLSLWGDRLQELASRHDSSIVAPEPMTGGAAIDASEVDASEVDASEVDASEVDGVEMDGAEADGAQRDGGTAGEAASR